jgi:hypothetical protein
MRSYYEYLGDVARQEKEREVNAYLEALKDKLLSLPPMQGVGRDRILLTVRVNRDKTHEKYEA